MMGTTVVSEEFKMTELGPLPVEWRVITLGDVAKVTSGGSAPQGKEFFNGQNPFVRVQHLELESDTIRKWDLITDEAVDKYSLKLYPKGTIVFPKSGASIYLEKRAILPVDSYIVSHLCAVISESPMVDQNFLFYYLRFLSFAEGKAEGYPTLNLTEIKKKGIACPPLPEQKKIAAVLSAVQEAKEKTEAVIKATRELKKSLMKHLFTYGPVPLQEAGNVPLKETEIGLVPEGWEVVRLGDLIEGTQYGISLRGTKQGRYPILRMNNLIDGQVDTSDLQYVDLDESTFGKFKLNRGDILFNRTNSHELVGKTALFDSDRNFVFASYLIRVVPETSRLLPQYLNYYLNWDKTQIRLKMLASRGVSQSNINATKLQNFQIPQPPIAVQQNIADILSAADRDIQVVENKKNALEELFRTLLDNLMTGKIRVNRLEVKV
ncbi:restriction endonuclease subunit S [Dehalococcoidales bacterium]|nr:restriction endonuclease subunit S [Dehalococcoidales bacterium]